MTRTPAHITLRIIALIDGLLGLACLAALGSLCVSFIMPLAHRFDPQTFVMLVPLLAVTVVLGCWMLAAAWYAWRQPCVDHARAATLVLAAAIYLALLLPLLELIPIPSNDMPDHALIYLGALALMEIARSFLHRWLDPRVRTDPSERIRPLLGPGAIQLITLCILLTGGRFAFVGADGDATRLPNDTSLWVLLATGVAATITYILLSRAYNAHLKR